MSRRRADRADRFRGIVLFLRVAAVAAFVVALAGTLAGERVTRHLGDALVVLFVAVPVVRVAWLVARWFGRGDRRFALAGCALLAVVATTLIVAST